MGWRKSGLRLYEDEIRSVAEGDPAGGSRIGCLMELPAHRIHAILKAGADEVELAGLQRALKIGRLDPVSARRAHHGSLEARPHSEGPGRLDHLPVPVLVVASDPGRVRWGELLLGNDLRGANARFRWLLVAWSAVLTADVIHGAISNPDGFEFHGDTLGIHLNLGVPVVAVVVGFSLLAVYWAYRGQVPICV